MPAPAMTVTQRFALGTALIALVAVWPGRATAAGSFFAARTPATTARSGFNCRTTPTCCAATC